MYIYIDASGKLMVGRFACADLAPDPPFACASTCAATCTDFGRMLLACACQYFGSTLSEVTTKHNAYIKKSSTKRTKCLRHQCLKHSLVFNFLWF